MILRSFLLFYCLIIGIGVQAQDLYDLKKVPEIKVVFAEKNWHQVMDSIKELGLEDRLVATVWIDGVKYDSIGVRYKGNSSYFNVRNSGSLKLPFNLKADEIRKKQSFKGGYTTLKLSNAFRDPSFLREPLSYEMAAKYMPVPRANFAKLYVNDVYMGLYNNTESIDNKFLRDHFGSDDGSFFKCDPDWSVKEIKGCPPGEKASLLYMGDDSTCYKPFYEKQSKHGWSDLLLLIKTLQQSPDSLESMLDVDQVLWMLAYDNAFVNLDSYIGRLSHNYYLYKDQTGRFTPLLWDLNLSLGGFALDGITPSSLPVDKLETLSPLIHYDNPKRPLISQLLKNRKYKKIYLAHYKTILNDFVYNNKYYTRAKEMATLIDPLVKNDPVKLYGYEAFKLNLDSTVDIVKTKIAGIAALMNGRMEYLQNHPLFKKTPPIVGEVVPKKEKTSVFFTVKVDNASSVSMFFRKNKFSAYQMVEMFDDGNHNDSKPNDGIYGAALELSNDIQYYIYAENEEAARFLPERAAFEYFELKL